MAPGVLLVAALGLIASLYLPWERPDCPGQASDLFSGPPAANLPNLFTGTCPAIDGWSTAVGTGTAVAALLVVALAAACLIHDSHGTALGQSALTAGVLGLAVVVQAPNAGEGESQILKIPFHHAYGTYVGVAAVAGLLVGASASPLRHHVQLRLAPAVLLLVAGGLLASLLLLPWQLYAHLKVPGVVYPAGLAAAALATLLPVAYWRSELVWLGAAIVLLVGAACSSVVFPATRAYGSWVGLGLAAVLAAMTLAGERPRLGLPRDARPLVVLVPACIGSLFLPWQHVCYPERCLSANAWAYPASPAVALLVLGLLLSVAPSRRVFPWELVAAASLFVATLGFSLVDRPELGEGFGLGAYVGFASFAALAAVVLVDTSPPTYAPRLIDCGAALLLCVAYLVLLLLPRWQVLRPGADEALEFGPFSWLTVAGVLLAVHLLARWLRRLPGCTPHDPLLVVLPLVLLALAALDLIRERGNGLTWGGGTVVALCLGLAGLGAVEGRGGLRGIPVPEILRIDRIS